MGFSTRDRVETGHTAVTVLNLTGEELKSGGLMLGCESFFRRSIPAESP